MNGLGNKEIMAKNIQYYLDLNGKTRNEICKDLGIKYSTFTDWFNGNTYPRIDKIEMMANYFGIQKSDLVETKGKKEEISYYINNETREIAQEIAQGMNENKDMKILFDMIRDVEPNVLRAYLQMLKVWKDLEDNKK